LQSYFYFILDKAQNGVTKKHGMIVIRPDSTDYVRSPGLNADHEHITTKPWKVRLKTSLKNFFYIPPRKIPPFIVGLVFFLMIAYIMAIVQVLIQNFSVKRKIDRNLPVHDVGFEVLPYIDRDTLPDLLVSGMLALSFFSIFISRGCAIMIVLVRRFLTVLAVVYSIRTISIAITLLPNPFPQCKASEMGHPMVDALLILAGYAKTCQDCFFSGHSVAISLASLIWFDYLNARMLFRLLAIPAAIIGAVIIISCHFHYSVDVMFGFLISFLVWKYYHSIIHRISRYLVRRKRDLENKGGIHPVSWWELARHFLKNEVGEVRCDELLPIEQKKQSTKDTFHIVLIVMLLRFVTWYETWDDILVVNHKQYEQV
jgi:membrane-associated phospholipid phosphatase